MEEFRVDFDAEPKRGMAGVNPMKYRKLAAEFINDTGHLVWYCGKLYLYTANRYMELENVPLRFRRWMLDKGRPCNNTTVGNVIAEIEAMAYSPHHDGRAMPYYRGKGEFPEATNVIAYENGLLDVAGYLKGQTELITHTPYWISTCCLPFKFDREAQCPRWLDFLNEIFDGDQQRVNLLQEWFGYCLTWDNSMQKLLLKLGVPRAGKGTVDRVLQALLGADNWTAYTLHCLIERFGKGRLVNKMVAFVSEVELGYAERKRIVEELKTITGGDPVSVEYKGQNDTPSITLPVRFTVSCNQMPEFVDPSGALAERLLILNFDRSFAGREDTQLARKLLTELPGIANWALQGYARLRVAKAFTKTAFQAELLNNFKRDNSTAYAFMQDRLVVNKDVKPAHLAELPETDRDIEMTNEALNELYLDWCNDERIAERDRKQFAWIVRDIKAALPTLVRDRRWMPAAKRKQVFWCGICSNKKVY